MLGITWGDVWIVRGVAPTDLGGQLKSSKVIFTTFLTLATVSGGLGLANAGAAQSPVRAAVSHSSTSAVTIKMSSTVAHPGSISVQSVTGTVLATCKGPKAKGTTSCTVHVPTGATSVFVAKLAKGVGFKDWSEACNSVPGPVCALFVSARSVRIRLDLVHSSSKAVVVTTLNAVEGDTTGCSGFLDAQMVHVAGFPANTSIAVKDDGNLVGTGKTNSSGTAVVNYKGLSEPGIYRIITVTGRTTKAKTDVYNAGSVCYTNTTPNGTIQFTVTGSDMDAKSKVTIQFGSNAPTIATADSNGAYSVTTSTYTCTTGSTANLSISTTRGAGTKFSRHFGLLFPVTC